MASLLELEAVDDACSEQGFAFDGELSDTGSDLDGFINHGEVAEDVSLHRAFDQSGDLPSHMRTVRDEASSSEELSSCESVADYDSDSSRGSEGSADRRLYDSDSDMDDSDSARVGSASPSQGAAAAAPAARRQRREPADAAKTASAAFREHLLQLRKSSGGAAADDVHAVLGTSRDHPRLLECLLAVSGAVESEEAVSLEAVLDAGVTRQREALALQRQQLSGVERVTHRTHRSLYMQRPRVVMELARKVHRLLRCLDTLVVKLRTRSILVGTELALDDGVVLRNLQRRCGGGSADAAESPVRLLWRVLEGAYQAELGVDAAREQRQRNALRNAISNNGLA
jgi:hypothetical protein